ncbi:MAG TPA: restriction endonuclease [Kiritimatiellia bacterium]|nr:restriction endonuclease [Kiritimatiellia bacterium]HMP00384.1 restriction endonuclease [Kiritimatiellia bacterium]
MGLIDSLLGLPPEAERVKMKAEYVHLVESVNKARAEYSALSQSITTAKADLAALSANKAREVGRLQEYRDKIAAREKRLSTESARLQQKVHHWNDHFNGLYQKGIGRILEVLSQVSVNPNDPVAAKAIKETSANLEYLIDRGRLDIFCPSNAGDLRKILANEKRQAAADRDYYRAVLEHLEDLLPGLTDLIMPEEASTGFNNNTEAHTIPEDQWNELGSSERSAIMLHRYMHGKRTWWQVGHDYELFVGQEYEKQGYTVEYYGEKKNIHDWGRDLICHHPDGHRLVVQCKCWAHYKEIYERHIFQLFGTSFLYKREQNQLLHVKPVFVTSTTLSPDAMNIANTLGIQVIENKALGHYKPIKCNISRATNERIYHLPWDQQYRTTMIEPKRGEFFAETIEEAESSGFKHAMRYLAAEE